MCESNVYLKNEAGEQLVVKDAVSIENDRDTIKVTDILGEQKTFTGEIEEISFLDHRIVIRSDRG